MLVPMRRGVRIDRHAAYGIAHALRRPARIASGYMSVPAMRPMRGTGARLGLACNRLFHGGQPHLGAATAAVADGLTLQERSCPYTIGGYISNVRKDIKASCAKRLNRIEGQVRGIARMVEDDRYCIDVVTQISAVRAALRRLEEEILRDHVGHCVEHAIASGNKAEQRRKIEELMNVVGRAER
jgi:CsoR family transcriptional regulator, copper-sensing transcriptional repressor